MQTLDLLLNLFLILVEDMIKEVDVDGDGRIDFYGQFSLNPFKKLVNKNVATLQHKNVKFDSDKCQMTSQF